MHHLQSALLPKAGHLNCADPHLTICMFTVRAATTSPLQSLQVNCRLVGSDLDEALFCKHKTYLDMSNFRRLLLHAACFSAYFEASEQVGLGLELRLLLFSHHSSCVLPPLFNYSTNEPPCQPRTPLEELQPQPLSPRPYSPP